MRVQIQSWRKPGGCKPVDVVVVARPSRLGNPYKVGIHGDAASCVDRYRKAMSGLVDNITQPAPPIMDVMLAVDRARAALPYLRGKRLACYCGLDQPCHADVLIELANQ